MVENDTLRDHQGLICSVALSFRNAGVDVEDLKQEASIAFLKALRLWDPNRGRALSTFAFSAMVHHLCNMTRGVRKTRARGTSFQSLDALDNTGRSMHELLGEEPNQERAFADNEALALLRSRFARLRPLHRDVLLGAIEGKTYRQIGEALGISKQAVEQRMRAGIELLRRECLPRDPGGRQASHTNAPK